MAPAAVINHRWDDAGALETLIENVPGAIYRCLPQSDWQMLILSAGVEEIVGYPASDFIGSRARDFASVIHPDDRDRVEESVGQAIADQRPFDLEYRVVHRDGPVRWVHERGRGVFGDDGTITYLDGAIFDVTQRKNAERRLGEFELEYRNLVENLPLAMYVNTLDGQMTYITPPIEPMLGYAVDEWTADGTLFGQLLHPDDRDRVRAAAERSQRLGLVFQEEFRLIARDGTEVWVMDKTVGVVDAAGKPRCRQGYLLDITDRKRAECEREAIELERRLSQRLESVGQLAAGIAHEINTPIQFVGDSVAFVSDAFTDIGSLIDAYRRTLGETASDAQRATLEALEQQVDLEYLVERVPIAVSRMTDGIDRVATIVRAMKEFSHPPSSNRAAADLNRALESTLVVATNEVKYVADIVTDLSPDLPLVTCNIGDLNQVFLNLIVNAAHAMGDRVGDHGRGTLTVTTRCVGEEVEIAVTDSGGGIPVAIRERIFDPFFTTKEVGKGTGQGLALARTIVVGRHGGRLTLESQIGVGSTFTIVLPVRGAPSLETAA